MPRTTSTTPKGAKTPAKMPVAIDLHAMLLQLDRLEELREELEELGLSSLEEIEARIAELEAIVGDDDESDS